MDEIACGIATAALTLHSVLLQALVHKGALTSEEGLDIVDRNLAASVVSPTESEEVAQVADVTLDCLARVHGNLFLLRPDGVLGERPRLRILPVLPPGARKAANSHAFANRRLDGERNQRAVLLGYEILVLAVFEQDERMLGYCRHSMIVARSADAERKESAAGQ